MSASDKVEAWYERIHEALDVSWPPVFERDDLEARLGPVEEGVAEAILEARVQKALFALLKSLLEEQPGLNRRFPAETEHKWLNQLLAVTRIKELASVKIVKKGRRGGAGYDITELARSYYGRQILTSLDFNASRKRVVTKAELEKIQAACAKVKLKLPEVVEPTTTERFFARDEADAEADSDADDAAEDKEGAPATGADA